MDVPKICEAHEKNGDPCTKEATVRVFWPGRSLVMCGEHADAAKRVAAAMGFDLSVFLLALALLVGCGPDAFYTIPPLEIEDAAAFDRASIDASELDDGLEASVDAPANVDAFDGAQGADASEPCPMIGASCSPVGLRKCRGPQLVWYCAGTWTSNACTQGNPACSPCDAGYCCTISPVCP
jgi:hypothetical protein